MVTKCETSKNALDIEALRKSLLVLTTSSGSSFPFLSDSICALLGNVSRCQQ